MITTIKSDQICKLDLLTLCYIYTTYLISLMYTAYIMHTDVYISLGNVAESGKIWKSDNACTHEVFIYIQFISLMAYMKMASV